MARTNLARIDIKSEDLDTKRVSLAALKWRDRTDKLTRACVDEMVIDLEAGDGLQWLDLVAYGYSLLPEKELLGVKSLPLPRRPRTPARTCAEAFHKLDGYLAGCAEMEAALRTDRKGFTRKARAFFDTEIRDQHDAMREQYRRNHPELSDGMSKVYGVVGMGKKHDKVGTIIT